ncbi:molybdopterin molybdotransferase MoeA [Streptomyces sp. NBC_01525]|uniref:molybdopterin molybdotransferase MoeA n=1 Tax=Streptomyces sp. NBC_01525 TaxID=2903893 RepID=UPI00386338DD
MALGAVHPGRAGSGGSGASGSGATVPSGSGTSPDGVAPGGAASSAAGSGPASSGVGSDAGTPGSGPARDARTDPDDGPTGPAEQAHSRTERHGHLRSGPAGNVRPENAARDARPEDTTDGPTPWPLARKRAARAAGGPRPPEPSEPEDALGRTLAEPLTALTDLPPFDTSAMDGWAVSGPGPWDLDRAAGGDRGILAGHAATALADGHAVAIATGARVPDGATAVLRSEHGEVHDRGDGRARLVAPRAVRLGQDIRPRGQECGRGEPLLPAGVPVTPAVLGLAAAAGYDRLTTYPRSRVEVLVLGDELLRHGLPREGRIRDALGPMLGPWLRALGADVTAPRPLGDDADVLHAAITGSTADVVLTTGGTASGPVDHVHPALRRIGAEVLVDGVAVRPGHPMLLARVAPDRYLVGLPGNPLAAVSGLLTLAEPLLRTLAARPPAASSRTPLGAAVDGHPHDTRLVPVAYRDDPRHGRTATPLPFHGSAMLRGIAAADALAVVPPGGADRGDLVEVLELPWPAGSAARGPEGAGRPYGPGAHPGGDRPVRSTFSAPPTGGAA